MKVLWEGAGDERELFQVEMVGFIRPILAQYMESFCEVLQAQTQRQDTSLWITCFDPRLMS